MASSLIGNGALDIAGAAAFTALIVQQSKFLVEYVAKPTDKNHDAVIRLYADVVAIVVVVLSEVVTGVLNVHNGHDWMTALVQGFSVGLAAIGGYHLLNGLDAQTPKVLTLGQQIDQAAGQNPPHTVLDLLGPLLASQTAGLAASQLPAAQTTTIEPLPLTVGPLQATQMARTIEPLPLTVGSLPIPQGTNQIEPLPAFANGASAATEVSGAIPIASVPAAGPPTSPMPQASLPVVATPPTLAIPPSMNGALNDPRQASAILAQMLQEQWDAMRAGIPGQNQPLTSAGGMSGI